LTLEATVSIGWVNTVIGAAERLSVTTEQLLAAAGIYGDIAREVGRRGDHAWDHRVVTPKREKLAWVARAGFQVIARARRWPAITPRSANLWTRST